MNNPIIRRELVGVLRNWRTVAAEIIFTLVLIGVVLLRWPTNAQVSLSGRQAQEMLRLFGYAFMTAMILIVPAFSAVSMVREKQAGTLALMLNTPLTPWSVFSGKVAAIGGVIALLMTLSIPAAAACYAMGGASLRGQIGPLYVLLALASLEYTVVGLYISTRSNRVDAALRSTYATVFALVALAVIPQQFAQGRLTGLPAEVCQWLAAFSPLSSILQVFGQSGVTHTGSMAAGSAVWRYVVVSIVVILWCTRATLQRLNSGLFDRPRSAGTITDESSGSVQAYRRVMYLWFFDPQRRSRLIGPLTNPVMIKEFRTSRFGRSHWMMRMIGACLIVSLALMLAAARGSEVVNTRTMGAILVILQSALIIIMTPGLAGGLIAGEIETGSWQLLRMTPLSARSIVLGKLLSVGRTLLLLLLATLPGYAVMLVIDPNEKTQVVNALVSLVIMAVFALLASASISSFCRRAATATAGAYGFLAVLCAGTLLVWLGRGSLFGFTLVDWILRLNPVAATLSAIHAPGFGHYNLIPLTWWIMAWGCGLAVVVLVLRTWRLTRPQ